MAKATFAFEGLYSSYGEMAKAVGHPNACAVSSGYPEEKIIRAEAREISKNKTECEVLGVHIYNTFKESKSKKWDDRHVIVLKSPSGRVFLVSGQYVKLIGT